MMLSRASPLPYDNLFCWHHCLQCPQHFIRQRPIRGGDDGAVVASVSGRPDQSRQTPPASSIGLISA